MFEFSGFALLGAYSNIRVLGCKSITERSRRHVYQGIHWSPEAWRVFYFHIVEFIAGNLRIFGSNKSHACLSWSNVCLFDDRRRARHRDSMV